jgi:hypothetical protein
LHLSDEICNLERVKLWKYLVLAGVAGVGVYAYLHREQLSLLWPHTDASSDSLSDAGGAAPVRSGTTQEVQAGRFRWQTIHRPEGFKVDMPGDIQKIEVPALSERGAVDQVQMILCNPETQTTFSGCPRRRPIGRPCFGYGEGWGAGAHASHGGQ